MPNTPSGEARGGRNLANLPANPSNTDVQKWQQDAFDFFRTNLPEGYVGSSVKPEDLEISYENEQVGQYVTGQFVNMSAKGTLPLISTGFLKVGSLPLQASNQALRRTRSDLEVVMALDNTGSMDASNNPQTEDRLSVLKTAARDLTETVLGASRASGVEGRAFIGLVPFAEVVNVGANANTRQWMGPWAAGNPNRQNYINNGWNGCVVEPYWEPNRNGKLPSKAWEPLSGFQPLTIVPQTPISRSNLGLNSNSGNNVYELPVASARTTPQPLLTNASGSSSWKFKNLSEPRNTATNSPTATSTEIFTMYSWANPDRCVASRAALFLTDNENALNSSINAMYSDGGTIIPTGLLWAWRMLDPNWRGNPGWGNATMPRDPEPKVLSKVIVLLTDGDNDATNPVAYSGYSAKPDNTSLPPVAVEYDVYKCTRRRSTSSTQNNNVSCPKNPSPVKKTSNVQVTANNAVATYQNPINSLRVRNPDDTGSTTTTNMTTIGYGQAQIDKTAMDGYLADLCEAVKEDGNGIKIYTVSLGSQVNSATKTLMEGCSSGASYAFNATNVAELPAVFQAIAGALTELRLTQ